MATTIFTRETKKKVIVTRAPHLVEVAETIRADALAQARAKLDPAWRDAHVASLLNRPDFIDYFKYGVAVGVSSALVANDQNIQAIYTYDPSTNADSDAGEDMPQDATVHLLVRVTTSTAALEAFVSSLDRALTASLKDLPSPRFAQRESILDVNLVTEDDVQRGSGYAGLLSGIFAPPLKVWQRA